MENNSIFNKINSIIVSGEKNNDNLISLLEYTKLVNNISKEMNILYKKFIKKANNKLSNNLNFFNYEIKNIEIYDKIYIVINHELTTKKIEINKDNLNVFNGFKNSSQFVELLKNDLIELLNKIEEYDFLFKIKIKSKFDDIHFIINYEFVEVFMYKSPNWITMGKAFSIKYLFSTQKFIYELDPINIRSVVNNQEGFLFSKISFNKNMLPNEFQIKYEYYKNNKIDSEKCSWLKKVWSNLLNMMKK